MDQYYLQQQQQLKQQQMLLMQQRDREQREREYILHQQQLQIEREKRQREEQRKRFLVELEFVQCLANPSYLHFLAKQGLFDNAAFKNYLKYLLYWKRPEYIRFIKYPECLFFLELIQREEMHESMKSPSCVSFISQQQLLHWQHYARNRDVTLSSSLNEISEQEDDSEVSHPALILFLEELKFKIGFCLRRTMKRVILRQDWKPRGSRLYLTGIQKVNTAPAALLHWQML